MLAGQLQSPCRAAQQARTRLRKETHMPILTPEELELLEQPSFATLATLRADGTPQLTVMWYRLVEQTLRMVAPAAAAKVRHLTRDPRVSIVIQQPENSYAYLELRGVAEIVRDDPLARADLALIAARYIGERATTYAASLSSAPRVLIVTRIESVRSHLSRPPAG
jgi:PPOX class probable F420-dependent enzyme